MRKGGRRGSASRRQRKLTHEERVILGRNYRHVVVVPVKCFEKTNGLDEKGHERRVKEAK